MSEDYTVYAVRAVQPWEETSTYWVPELYKELKEGRSRFGWGWLDLKKLQEKLHVAGGKALNKEEKDIWSHASFLLEVGPGDHFVYINMPEYGQCTIVRIINRYTFDEIWNSEGRDDFRHCLPCEFLGTFDRNDHVVPPYLSARLKLQGAKWRISCQKEFEELLDALKQGTKGKTPRRRLQEDINDHLKRIAKDIQSHFPEKKLEPLVKEIFENMPNVMTVRKGPDKNGADLEVEFDFCPGIPSLGKTALCAVQVKSYEGQMAHKRAIEDIRKAFASSSDYTCGLIVSTALELTEDFENELNALRAETDKQVGILIGKDLAYVLLKHSFRGQAE